MRQLWAWQASNPPPPGLNRAQLEGLIRARLPELLLRAIVALVRPAMDEGPIIAQAAVAVLDSDTPESLAARVLAEEHAIYPAVLARVAEGRTRVQGNRVYFGEPATLPPPLRVPFAE